MWEARAVRRRPTAVRGDRPAGLMARACTEEPLIRSRPGRSASRRRPPARIFDSDSTPPGARADDRNHDARQHVGGRTAHRRLGLGAGRDSMPSCRSIPKDFSTNFFPFFWRDRPADLGRRQLLGRAPRRAGPASIASAMASSRAEVVDPPPDVGISLPGHRRLGADHAFGAGWCADAVAGHLVGRTGGERPQPAVHPAAGRPSTRPLYPSPGNQRRMAQVPAEALRTTVMSLEPLGLVSERSHWLRLARAPFASDLRASRSCDPPWQQSLRGDGRLEFDQNSLVLDEDVDDAAFPVDRERHLGSERHAGSCRRTSGRQARQLRVLALSRRSRSAPIRPDLDDLSDLPQSRVLPGPRSIMLIRPCDVRLARDAAPAA